MAARTALNVRITGFGVALSTAESGSRGPPTSHGWAASPVGEGDLLLVNANTLAIALDKSTGQLVWTVEDGAPSAQYGSFATTVVEDPKESRRALFLDKGTLSAVEIGTGNRLWSFSHGERAHPVVDPIVCGNREFLMHNENCMLLEGTAEPPEGIDLSS